MSSNFFKSEFQNLDSIESPYEFLHVWQSLKNDADLSLHAQLLRSLAPEDLDTGTLCKFVNNQSIQTENLNR